MEKPENSKERPGLIFFLLFMAFAVVLIIVYLFPTNPQSPDLSPAVAPHISPMKPATQEITAIDSLEKNGNAKVQVDYYIIIESFRNIMQAEKKADKLSNDFNTNIIILPPTTEGYYRISYGKYSTLEEAKSVIKSIRTKISSNAWIFSLKK